MHPKVLVFAIIILLTSVSFMPSISGNIKQQNSVKTFFPISDKSDEKITTPIGGQFKVCIYTDGNCEETITFYMNRYTRDKLMDEMNLILGSELTLHNKFEQFLETLQKFNIVSEDITLNDILDEELLTQPFKQVNNTDFKAHFAPIIIAGGGVGIGMGYPDLRPFNVFLHLLTVIAGLGWVFCLDPLEGILYKLQSFLFPLLIGYLSAYTGLIVLAVFPGFFYSNILAIGFTPFTAWVQFPSPEPEE